MSLGRLLGYLILALVVVVAALGIVTKKGVVKDEKTTEFLRKQHEVFGYITVLVGLVHAVYNFSLFGPNIFGALTLIILITQVVVGKLSNRSGASPRLQVVHSVLPVAFLVAVVLHIFA